MANLEVRVKVSMKRNYGRTDVEFEIESESPVQFEGSTIQADLFTAKLIEYFDHFEKHTLPQLGKEAKPTVMYSEVKEVATRLFYTLDKGKRGYKIVCGRWQKFGVPIYPEVLTKCNINPAEVPEDGYEFPKGTSVIVQLENNEPKRVTNIVTP